MKKLIGVIILIIIVVVIIIAGNGKKGDEGPIKIGFIGPLSGDAGNIGQNAMAGVEIAVKEVNDNGGINGRPLEVIYEDGKCNGKDALSAASKLINIDKVPVILGGACSGETMAFTNLAEQNKTVVFSYCSSNPAITTAGDYIFRDYPSDSFQGKFSAEYIYNKMGKKKAAVVYTKTDWGVGIKDVFTNEFKKLGGSIVAEEGYDQTTRDFRAQLSKVKSSNPEIVYFLGYTDSIPGIKQVRELGITVPIFGGDGWDDAKIWSEVGSAGEGAMYPTPSSNQSSEFKSAMAAKTGTDEVIACTPGAYDGIKILSQVIKNVGTNSEDIKNELYKVDYLGGVSSKEVRFDENGDLSGAEYTLKVVHDGKAEVLQ